jgi:microcystin-dependent protein
MNEPLIGSILLFAGGYAPSGWALCNGQTLPIEQNTVLFSVIGTIYGGDGQTNFALPNLAPPGEEGPQYIIATQGVFPRRV